MAAAAAQRLHHGHEFVGVSRKLVDDSNERFYLGTKHNMGKMQSLNGKRQWIRVKGQIPTPNIKDTPR